MSFERATQFSHMNIDPLSEEMAEEEVCISNISLPERRKRLYFGIHQFVIAISILAILIGLRIDPLWRLPLFFIFWTAGIGYFQARDRT